MLRHLWAAPDWVAADHSLVEFAIIIPPRQMDLIVGGAPGHILPSLAPIVAAVVAATVDAASL